MHAHSRLSKPHNTCEWMRQPYASRIPASYTQCTLHSNDRCMQHRRALLTSSAPDSANNISFCFRCISFGHMWHHVAAGRLTLSGNHETVRAAASHQQQNTTTMRFHAKLVPFWMRLQLMFLMFSARRSIGNAARFGFWFCCFLLLLILFLLLF